jgi:hypothetical protein
MVPPMIGFLFLLIVVGGIISLAAVIESSHTPSAPHIGFPMFFAGFCSLVLTFGLAALGNSSNRGNLWGSFGYVLGLMVGAILGLIFAGRHKRHLIQTPIEADADDDES